MFNKETINKLAKSFNDYIENAFLDERDIDPREALLIMVESHAVFLGANLDDEEIPAKLQGYVADLTASLKEQGLEHADYIIENLPDYG